MKPDGPESLLGYLAAVEAGTTALLKTVGPADLDRIVDRRWDPPISMGVRLVSIADDSLQHVGQAAIYAACSAGEAAAQAEAVIP